MPQVAETKIEIFRVVTGQGNVSEIFKGLEKSGHFGLSQRNLGFVRKVREFQGRPGKFSCNWVQAMPNLTRTRSKVKGKVVL